MQDDVDDWDGEAAKMADVYRNAWVTIVADSSSDSYAGIYNEASGSLSHFDGQEFLGFSDTSNDGSRITLLMYPSWPDEQWSEMVEQSDLSTRGWCCQEFVLQYLHESCTSPLHSRSGSAHTASVVRTAT